jgi:hypothetical protein
LGYSLKTRVFEFGNNTFDSDVVRGALPLSIGNGITTVFWGKFPGSIPGV